MIRICDNGNKWRISHLPVNPDASAPTVTARGGGRPKRGGARGQSIATNDRNRTDEHSLFRIQYDLLKRLQQPVFHYKVVFRCHNPSTNKHTPPGFGRPPPQCEPATMSSGTTTPWRRVPGLRRLNGCLAQRVPIRFLASSFRMRLKS